MIDRLLICAVIVNTLSYDCHVDGNKSVKKSVGPLIC